MRESAQGPDVGDLDGLLQVHPLTTRAQCERSQPDNKKRDETALEANVQIVDLKSDLRTEKLVEQFQTGWTAEDLEAAAAAWRRGELV